MTTSQASTARRIASAVVLAASVALIVWIVANDEEGLAALESVSPIAVLGLVPLLAADFTAQAYRYKLTVDEASGQQVPMWPWFRLFVIGRFLNALIPQAGNAYRAVRLKEDYAIPITRYLSGLVAFTWLSTLLNLILTLILVAVFEPQLRLGDSRALWVILGLLVVAAAAPPAASWVIQRLKIDRGAIGWVYRRVRDMVSGAVRIAGSSATVTRFGIVGVAGAAASGAAFYIAFRALGFEASVSTVMLFFVLQQFGNYVQVTPGNLGLLELLSAALATQVGFAATTGLLVSALIRLVRYGILLVGGLSVGGLDALNKVRSSRAGA